jgi:hypothetical protein
VHWQPNLLSEERLEVTPAMQDAHDLQRCGLDDRQHIGLRCRREDEITVFNANNTIGVMWGRSRAG